MGRYRIEYDGLQNPAEELQNAEALLQSFHEELLALSREMDTRDSTMAILVKELAQCAQELPELALELAELRAALMESETAYRQAEMECLGLFEGTAHGGGGSGWGNPLDPVRDYLHRCLAGAEGLLFDSPFSRFRPNLIAPHLPPLPPSWQSRIDGLINQVDSEISQRFHAFTEKASQPLEVLLGLEGQNGGSKGAAVLLGAGDFVKNTALGVTQLGYIGYQELKSWGTYDTSDDDVAERQVFQMVSGIATALIDTAIDYVDPEVQNEDKKTANLLGTMPGASPLLNYMALRYVRSNADREYEALKEQGYDHDYAMTKAWTSASLDAATAALGAMRVGKLKGTAVPTAGGEPAVAKVLDGFGDARVIDGRTKILDDSLPSGVTKELLLDTASTSGKGGVTPIGRAFQKHMNGENRAGTFVGEKTGNPGKNTQQGLGYLDTILNSPNSTVIAKEHKQFGSIIDIRLPDGTGVRFTADGQTFIGLLEKYTPKQ